MLEFKKVTAVYRTPCWLYPQTQNHTVGVQIEDKHINLQIFGPFEYRRSITVHFPGWLHTYVENVAHFSGTFIN